METVISIRPLSDHATSIPVCRTGRHPIESRILSDRVIVSKGREKSTAFIINKFVILSLSADRLEEGSQTKLIL